MTLKCAQEAALGCLVGLALPRSRADQQSNLLDQHEAKTFGTIGIDLPELCADDRQEPSTTGLESPRRGDANLPIGS